MVFLLFTNYFALAFIGLQIVSVKIQTLLYNGMHDSYCLNSLSHSEMVEISVMHYLILFCDIFLLFLYIYVFNIFFICILTVSLQRFIRCADISRLDVTRQNASCFFERKILLETHQKVHYLQNICIYVHPTTSCIYKH